MQNLTLHNMIVMYCTDRNVTVIYGALLRQSMVQGRVLV